MAITNAVLAQQVDDLLSKWTVRETEYNEWITGSSSGGTNSDGLYPLTMTSGELVFVKAPATLQEEVDGIVASAQAYADAASLSETNAAASATEATTQKDLAIIERQASEAAKDLAELAYGDAANAQSITLGYRDETLAARDEVAGTNLNIILANQDTNVITEEQFVLNKINIIHASVPNSTVQLPNTNNSYLVWLSDVVEGGGNITFTQEE